LAARVAGVVRAPRHTFAALAAAPRPPWLDVLIFSTLVITMALSAFLATGVGQTALVDQAERTSIAFGRPIDDAAYMRLQALRPEWPIYAVGIALVSGPLLTLVVAALVTMVFNALGQVDVTYRRTLAIVAHAGVILAIRQVIAAPINYLGETLVSPTTLVQLVSGLDEGSPLARFLGVLDVFVLWWIVVLAIGVATLTRRRIRPLWLAFTGIYVAVALLLALAMAVSGGAA
jgi:hypothetical protein